MSLHDEIMNLAIPRVLRSKTFFDGVKLMRHAAAELAIKADEEIARLKAENEALKLNSMRWILISDADLKDDEEVYIYSSRGMRYWAIYQEKADEFILNHGRIDAEKITHIMRIVNPGEIK
jgi:hypothetical protein